MHRDVACWTAVFGVTCGTYGGVGFTDFVFLRYPSYIRRVIVYISTKLGEDRRGGKLIFPV
jgi:hypothetical protein